MSRVSVSESVLRWSLKRSGRSVEELRSKFPKIEEWITGVSLPTLRQLESFARTTLTPLGFFFLSEPPEQRLPIPHFRTLGNEEIHGPSPELVETIHMMQRRQGWMREYLIEEDHEPLPFVGSSARGEHTQTVAKRMRDLLNIDENWASKQPTWENALRSLRERSEASGILVVVNGILGNNTHRKLDPAEFRGFVLVDDYAPLLFINGSDSKAAQMFTLGHELAHVFFGSSAAFDLRQLQPADDATERACNQVAAEFLVPEKALREHWPSVRGSERPFQEIARHFKVSVLVAARRALDLQLITREQFFEFYHQYQEELRRSRAGGQDGGQFYANQNLRVGRRFASAVFQATSEGRLLYSEAYRLTDLYGSTFEEYMSTLGAGGR